MLRFHGGCAKLPFGAERIKRRRKTTTGCVGSNGVDTSKIERYLYYVDTCNEENTRKTRIISEHNKKSVNGIFGLIRKHARFACSEVGYFQQGCDARRCFEGSLNRRRTQLPWGLIAQQILSLHTINAVSNNFWLDFSWLEFFLMYFDDFNTFKFTAARYALRSSYLFSSEFIVTRFWTPGRNSTVCLSRSGAERLWGRSITSTRKEIANPDLTARRAWNPGTSYK